MIKIHIGFIALCAIFIGSFGFYPAHASACSQYRSPEFDYYPSVSPSAGDAPLLVTADWPKNWSWVYLVPGVPTFSINWGDGSGSAQVPSEDCFDQNSDGSQGAKYRNWPAQNLTHTYATPGTYIPKFSITSSGETFANSTYDLPPVVVSAPIPQYPLSVSRSGTGSGVVSSNSGDISCGTTCAANYPEGTSVSLTASPDANSTFTSWGGACSGAGVCQVSMDAAKSVTATFTLIPPPKFTLSVTKAGTGSGTVTSAPGGISCGADCSEPYTKDTSVTLSPAAASGSTFAGWGGACSGTGSCVVPMTADKSVNATFTINPVTPPPPPANITVNAGPDRTNTTSDNVSLAGSVTGQTSSIQWSKVSGSGNVSFANSRQPNTTAIFDKPGTYVVRLTATGGGQTKSDTATVVIKDHYYVEFKSWIPHPTFADPYVLESFNFPTLMIPLMKDGPLKSCLAAAAQGVVIGGSVPVVSSSVITDNHVNFGSIKSGQSDYRIRNTVEFDFDGSSITNFKQNASTLESKRTVTVRNANGTLRPCTMSSIGPNGSTKSVVTGAKTLHLNMHGSTPLAPQKSDLTAICSQLGALKNICLQNVNNVPLNLIAPAIDGDLDGFLKDDGDIYFTYKTDLFPSYGVAVQRNGNPYMSPVLADASCVVNTGVKAAANLLVGLQTNGNLARFEGTVDRNSANKPCKPTAISPALVNAMTLTLNANIPNQGMLLLISSYFPR